MKNGVKELHKSWLGPDMEAPRYSKWQWTRARSREVLYMLARKDNLACPGVKVEAN